MKISCMKLEADIKGKITRKAELSGIAGYGVRFVNLSRPQKQKISRIIGTLQKIGAQDRLVESITVSEEVIDRSVQNSPYKIVLFFRKLLLKDVG